MFKIMNAHSLEMRKELGAYYTPSALSQVMSDWAIRRPTDKILEPSFGGCGFLESCEKSLMEIGCINPMENLFGVDVDQKAFDTLQKKYGHLLIKKHFILRDFINVFPKDFGIEDFEVIIGNPPYISMHNMSYEQRKSCEKVFADSPFKTKTLGRNASLWGFFLLHALSFIRENGRIAWVLPSSFLNAYYAKELIRIYKNHFNHLKIIKINERLFKNEGADEMSVLFLCDEFHRTPINNGYVSVGFADTLNEITSIMTGTKENKLNSSENYKYNILDIDTLNVISSIAEHKYSLKIKDIADIKIGMVTGMNNFFILDQNQILKHNLDKKHFRPVISRFSHLKGIHHTLKRHTKLIADNKKGLLLHVSPDDLYEKHSPLRKYLSQVDRKERTQNRTFKKRKKWFQPDDDIYPDAFFSYMVHEFPRMILNKGKVNCTNSIHRIFFKDIASNKLKKACCISLLSTFSQLSAELEGRSYGSGVLKIEPTAGKNISFLIKDDLIHELSNLSKEIDKLLLNNETSNATALVDKFFVDKGLISLDELKSLKKGLFRLRKDRYKGVKNYE
ncbi:N-6 DNA methylase [Salmonella enterica]|nr:N-6 DNA methylase [Salmonella enterica]